jgi:hypothetical protein
MQHLVEELQNALSPVNADRVAVEARLKAYLDVDGDNALAHMVQLIDISLSPAQPENVSLMSAVLAGNTFAFDKVKASKLESRMFSPSHGFAVLAATVQRVTQFLGQFSLNESHARNIGMCKGLSSVLASICALQMDSMASGDVQQYFVDAVLDVIWRLANEGGGVDATLSRSEWAIEFVERVTSDFDYGEQGRRMIQARVNRIATLLASVAARRGVRGRVRCAALGAFGAMLATELMPLDNDTDVRGVVAVVQRALIDASCASNGDDAHELRAAAFASLATLFGTEAGYAALPSMVGSIFEATRAAVSDAVASDGGDRASGAALAALDIWVEVGEFECAAFPRADNGSVSHSFVLQGASHLVLMALRALASEAGTNFDDGDEGREAQLLADESEWSLAHVCASLLSTVAKLSGVEQVCALLKLIEDEYQGPEKLKLKPSFAADVAAATAPQLAASIPRWRRKHAAMLAFGAVLSGFEAPSASAYNIVSLGQAARSMVTRVASTLAPPCSGRRGHAIPPWRSPLFHSDALFVLSSAARYVGSDGDLLQNMCRACVRALPERPLRSEALAELVKSGAHALSQIFEALGDVICEDDVSTRHAVLKTSLSTLLAHATDARNIEHGVARAAGEALATCVRVIVPRAGDAPITVAKIVLAASDGAALAPLLPAMAALISMLGGDDRREAAASGHALSTLLQRLATAMSSDELEQSAGAYSEAMMALSAALTSDLGARRVAASWPPQQVTRVLGNVQRRLLAALRADPSECADVMCATSLCSDILSAAAAGNLPADVWVATCLQLFVSDDVVGAVADADESAAAASAALLAFASFLGDAVLSHAELFGQQAQRVALLNGVVFQLGEFVAALLYDVVEQGDDESVDEIDQALGVASSLFQGLRSALTAASGSVPLLTSYSATVRSVVALLPRWRACIDCESVLVPFAMSLADCAQLLDTPTVRRLIVDASALRALADTAKQAIAALEVAANDGLCADDELEFVRASCAPLSTHANQVGARVEEEEEEAIG